MATHVVPEQCLLCNRSLEEGEKAYYLAPCTVTRFGHGGYDGHTVGTGRGAGKGELRIKFFGGVRKDRRIICVECYNAVLK